MKLIYSPDPMRSVIWPGPSDGEFSLALAARSEGLIDGALELVGSTSKLRLGFLDENTERIFCLIHFFGVRSLFGGFDIVRLLDSGSVIDGNRSMKQHGPQSHRYRGPQRRLAGPLY
jgi:hypothetical protein